MKRLIITLTCILCFALVLTSCSLKKTEADPEINLEFNITNLTDEDFQSVGTKELVNATKDDFKNIELTLDVKHSSKITNRKIVLPDIRININSYDKFRYWFGESSSQDNQEEKFAKYTYNIVFYSKGLDNEAIKSIFNSSAVKISWTDKDGKNGEKIINMAEAIQFK